MPVSTGLPSPRIATKLYATIAILLAMVCALAAGAIQLADHTRAALDGLRLGALVQSAQEAGSVSPGPGPEARRQAIAHRADTITRGAWAIGGAALLLVGPLGFLILYRSLWRLHGIASALNRLARNDISVDVPDVAAQDEFGQLARAVAVFKARSIELMNRNADFERLNLQLDAAINNMPLGLSMFDAHERLLVCNRRYAEMYEVPSELTERGTAHCALWEHRTRRGARHSKMRAETQEAAEQGAVASPAMQIEFDNGRIISVSRQPLRGGGWVSLHEDITERRRQEEKITHLARHDSLTGLANRVLFREQLEQCLQHLLRGQGFAVLCLDLDHFKAVNDTLGHPVGDQLLKQVGQRLLGCVRHGDLVARLGGDEFAIIQANVRDPSQPESLAARIVEAIGASFQIDGNPVSIGTSVGITLAPRDGSEADKLLKNADLALYRSKSAGRHGYSFFEARMDEQLQSRRSLEVDLRRVLAEEALEVVFQPVVCLRSDEIVGFEALPCWDHPERGSIPPEECIAIAEERGLSAELGNWTLLNACSRAAHWPQPCSVAVNVSAAQFLKRNLIEGVLQALAQSGLPARRLQLEITETVLLHESQNVLAMLHQLRQLGVRIALDGFGAGYCSLAHLRAFPFDAIKLDKVLVAEVERREESRAIVQSVIALGRSLGVTTVAEGIDDAGQLALVRAAGCNLAQGMLVAGPATADEVPSFLAQRRASGEPGHVNPASGESGAPPGSSRAA
jgi:diguanylate cyclase (GGDEF)-like protein